MVHIRQPRDGQPLHGRLPFTPARLTAYGEEWDTAEPLLFAEGEIHEASHGGESLRLRRRIKAPIGGTSLHIRDAVENIAADPVLHEMLYHFNLGWPVDDNHSSVSLDGKDLLGPLTMPGPTAVSAQSWPCERSQATVVLTGKNPASGLIMKFRTDTLGHQQLWRDLRRNVGVFLVEPCTSRLPTDETATAAELPPGE